LKKTAEMSQEVRTNFFKNIKKEGDIDDVTFGVWKSELQKELPSFWESMQYKK